MNILIFSDSHGGISNIEKMLERQISSPDAIVFLGDGLRDLDRVDTGESELYCVRGNCDFYSPLEQDEQLISLGGVRIFITHGHLYSVKSGFSALAERAMRIGADALLFGHTHTPLSLCISQGERVGDTVAKKPLHIFNPGSLREGCFGTIEIRGGVMLFNGAYL